MVKKNNINQNKEIDIRIPNELCQVGDGEDGFKKLGDHSNSNYITFIIYVYLKQKSKWKKVSLTDIYNDLPYIDIRKDRAINKIIHSLLVLERNNYIELTMDNIQVYNRNKHISMFEKMNHKSKDTFTVKVVTTRRKFFSVNGDVFNIMRSCGVKELALYLVLKKNAYQYIPEIDVNVAQYKQEVIAKVSNMNTKTVRKYLRVLEDQYYIVTIKQSVIQNKDGTFAGDGDKYIVIDSGLGYEDRKVLCDSYIDKINSDMV